MVGSHIPLPRSLLTSCLRPLLAIALTLGLGVSPAIADTGQLELKVKSAFIYNFTKYITWPVSETNKPQTLLSVCVAKNSDIFELVEETIDGKVSIGRTVEVSLVRDRTALSGCDLVYAQDTRIAQEWRDELSAYGIVTIGEGGNFVDEGGVFGFVVLDGKMRFEINLAKAEKKGLKISSKLLSLAQRVVY